MQSAERNILSERNISLGGPSLDQILENLRKCQTSSVKSVKRRSSNDVCDCDELQLLLKKAKLQHSDASMLDTATSFFHQSPIDLIKSTAAAASASNVATAPRKATASWRPSNESLITDNGVIRCASSCMNWADSSDEEIQRECMKFSDETRRGIGREQEEPKILSKKRSAEEAGLDVEASFDEIYHQTIDNKVDQKQSNCSNKNPDLVNLTILNDFWKNKYFESKREVKRLNDLVKEYRELVYNSGYICDSR
ncbi:hypothetical protein TKK_0005278 [Trichogramma kaykai]